MKKLPDCPSDVVFPSVVFDRSTVEFGVVKLSRKPSGVLLIRVVLSTDIETGAVMIFVLLIVVVASFSTAKTNKAPALYPLKV